MYRVSQGIRGHQRGVRGIGGVRVALGDGRKCRCSGAGRGIGVIKRTLGVPRGCRGIMGH